MLLPYNSGPITDSTIPLQWNSWEVAEIFILDLTKSRGITEQKQTGNIQPDNLIDKLQLAPRQLRAPGYLWTHHQVTWESIPSLPDFSHSSWSKREALRALSPPIQDEWHKLSSPLSGETPISLPMTSAAWSWKNMTQSSWHPSTTCTL